jgi:catechol 2,3-dioxygenase
MALTGVLRPGHVQLRVLDLEAAVKHYTQVLGLWETGRDPQGRVYLKAWDEHDHHSVVLREAEEAGMDYLGWKVDSPATLQKLSADIKASGLATDTRWIEAGEHPKTGERFRFTIPTGHAMELFADKAQIGNGMPLVNPEVHPDNLRGMSPTRFDHCLLYGDDLDGALTLFRDVLGFTVAEQVVAGPERALIGMFLTCSNKPHDVAFIRQPVKGKLHHISFFLDSWHELLKAADLVTRHRVSLDLGPTRHGITRGETLYFFDPSGNRNEVFAGGYISYPDRPVLTWTDDDIGRAIFYHYRKIEEKFLSVFT